MRKLTAVILAAGRGVRMKSATPKVLHELCGKAVLSYSLDLCFSLKVEQIIVVVGWGKDKVVSFLGKNYADKKIEVVVQKNPLGTADAVLSAKNKIARGAGDLLVLYADQPLLELATLKNLLREHSLGDCAATFLSAELDNPCGYGRVIRDLDGGISIIREDKNLNPDEVGIKEVNAGSCIFKKNELFSVINKIKPDNIKHEYYLTEVVRLFAQRQKKISSVGAQNQYEILGINSRAELVNLARILYRKTADKFLSAGVTIESPETVFINSGVRIGSDTVIKPFVYIDSGVVIGKNCVIGPFSHIRGMSVVKDNALVGSFTELNRSWIGPGSRIKHFSYLGDAFLGANVNIGAGTVTANFDGKNKHKTLISDGAFIGSDTVLVAPVRIGRRAVTGAGCVVTRNKDVPDNAVVAGVPACLLKNR